MRLGLIRALALATALSSDLALSDNVLQLAGKEYVEGLESKLPTSGTTMMGVQISRNGLPLDPGKLHVFVPANMPADEVLCVGVTTSSGLYWSRNQYRSTNLSGWARLDTRSAHSDVLRQFQFPAFAVLAQLRHRKRVGGSVDEECSHPDPRAALLVGGVVGRTEDLPSRPTEVTVLINSKRLRGNAELRVLGTAKPVAQSQCHRITDVSTRTYDARCDLDVSQLPAPKYDLVVTLSEPGEISEETTVPLILR
jgi:hypothetical protein